MKEKDEDLDRMLKTFFETIYRGESVKVAAKTLMDDYIKLLWKIENQTEETEGEGK